MKHLFLGTITAALLLLAALPGAHADPGNGNSWFGLCTAYGNNDNGRENGNAGNATAFQRLQQQAEDAGYDTVEEFCDTVPHPGNGGNGNGNGNGNGGRGPPDGVPGGPPV